MEGVIRMNKGIVAFAFAALVAVIMMVSSPVAQADTQNRIVFQVNSNDPALLNLVLNNVNNVETHYLGLGQEVEIEVVTYGPGLDMLIDGKSPVAKRIAGVVKSYSNVTFSACGNTMKKVTKKTGKEPKLLSGARVVPAGLIRIIELQNEGWNYIKP